MSAGYSKTITDLKKKEKQRKKTHNKKQRKTKQYTLISVQSQKQTYSCICIYTHSYIHLIYISHAQDHMYAHILAHSHTLSDVYSHDDTQKKTLYRNSRILSDTLKLFITRSCCNRKLYNNSKRAWRTFRRSMLFQTISTILKDCLR